MSVETTLRPPRVGDGEDLARIWMEIGGYYAGLAADLFRVPDAVGLAAWFEEWAPTINSEDVLFLVAERGGRIVGSVFATISRPAGDARWQVESELGLVRVTIEALGVEQASWRQGVGTELMTAAEEWARGRGAVVALLDTWIGSPVSVPFYEHRMGYDRRALRMRKTLR